MNQRWKKRPEGSNWGDFGPDDQRGRLNLITAEKVRQGVAEVREGRAFCLSMPLDLPGSNLLHPARFPPKRLSTVSPDGGPRYLAQLSKEDPRLVDVICDDQVVLHTQYSTQWDALAHVGAEFDADDDGVAETVFYNGWRGGDDITMPPGDKGPLEGVEARRLGIENMAEACVQGRAVMVDLEAHFGDRRVAVGWKDLDGIMKEDSVTVEEGDMLCLHTGWGRMVMDAAGAPDRNKLHGAYSGLDGRDADLLKWITDSGVSVLIADNYAVEIIPDDLAPGGCCRLPLHHLCLFKLGIHLGEIWHLSELADWLRANGRSRFLLTAPPLRLPGAVGSPAMPVATV